METGIAARKTVAAWVLMLFVVFGGNVPVVAKLTMPPVIRTVTPAATGVTVNGQPAARYGDNTFALVHEVRYVYDGRLVVEERNGANQPRVTYTRGKDLRACFKIPRGAVFAENPAWRGATKENIPGGSSTEKQRSQAVCSAKTLRAAGLSPGAGVSSAVTAHIGDAPALPPWPQPKSLAAAPLAILKHALSGSLSGAGGIGGLLARSHRTDGPNHHFYYHADGGGNVTAIINQSQNLVAQYAYDPFGRLLMARGALAEGN